MPKRTLRNPDTFWLSVRDIPANIWVAKSGRFRRRRREGRQILVLRDVVHISVYRQRIYYILCSLQYINKYTITVFINKKLFFFYDVCIHNECIHNHLFIIIRTCYCNNLSFIHDFLYYNKIIHMNITETVDVSLAQVSG